MRVLSLVLALLVLAPAWTFAQGSITGVVRDSSGGVLPGVTVDASSDVLIEKTRSAVTDSNGQYRIVDLRAGRYTVTFTLSGFSTYRRAGVTIEGAFTATVNADMTVGALQETVAVTSESPIVDVQSVKRQVTIDSDTISAIPASRSYASLMQLMPNTVTQTGGAMDTQVVPGMVVFGGAGGRSNEGRLNIDGISVGSAFNGAGVSSYIADIGNAREVTMTTSGGLGENEGGGPSLNVLPRDGGNTLRGTFYAAGVSENMIDNNITADLEARNLTAPNRYRKLSYSSTGIAVPTVREPPWTSPTSRVAGSGRPAA